jgi:hypothetical protein
MGCPCGSWIQFSIWPFWRLRGVIWQLLGQSGGLSPCFVFAKVTVQYLHMYELKKEIIFGFGTGVFFSVVSTVQVLLKMK